MTKTTLFSDILAALMEVYEKPLSSAAQDLYIRAMANEDPELMRLAAARAIKTLKWFPKVSELLDLVRAIKDEQEQEHSFKYHADRAQAVAGSRWIPMEIWERRSQREIAPVVVSWEVCPDCGQKYAGWDDCPECTLEVTA